MEIPDNLKYTKDHEWVRYENGIATMGITDFAQEQLGDIVFVELPEEGEEVQKGESFGVVESVKAVSDIYAAISGKVLEVNNSLEKNPEMINEDCYEEGWLIKVQANDPNEFDDLMTEPQYKALTQETKI